MALARIYPTSLAVNLSHLDARQFSRDITLVITWCFTPSRHLQAFRSQSYQPKGTSVASTISTFCDDTYVMATIENLQKEILAFITNFDLPGNGNHESRLRPMTVPVPVSDLLSIDLADPIRRESQSGTIRRIHLPGNIRWIHLPGNIMVWIEVWSCPFRID